MPGLYFFLALAFFLYPEAALVPVRWYRSNSSGMALEYSQSRLAALRNEYALSIEAIGSGLVPELILPYLEDGFSIELRTLYEQGRESRRQWLFRDESNIVRLVASGSRGLFDADASEDEAKSGFIEIRNMEGQAIRELRFENDSSQWEFLFTYSQGTLLNVETLFNDIAVSTDIYSYSRFGSIRAIDRMVHEGGTVLSRHAFPRIGFSGSSAGGTGAGNESVFQGMSYTSLFLQNIAVPAGAVISYNVDSRGRILAELWKDEDGEVLGEFVNTWSTERLLSVEWIYGEERRLVEYEYNSSGERIRERNYRSGILERVVSFFPDREIEEIFLDDRVILRAVWEEGRRVSEERIPPREGTR